MVDQTLHGEMAQWSRGGTAPAKDLSLVPNTHMVAHSCRIAVPGHLTPLLSSVGSCLHVMHMHAPWWTHIA